MREASVPGVCCSPAYVARAVRVFLQPGTRYPWYQIVPRAVGKNTIRSYTRIDKNCPGALRVFQEYFLRHESQIMKELSQLATREELHRLENRICEELRKELVNIEPSVLKPYNKIRKPVDLYIEHLVAMASELDTRRARLIPLLFLPLDSWIIQQPEFFTNRELADHGLTRNSGYGAIKTEENYLALQELVVKKAKTAADQQGKPFHPIFFDLLWSNRWTREGSNLFETNP